MPSVPDTAKGSLKYRSHRAARGRLQRGRLQHASRFRSEPCRAADCVFHQFLNNQQVKLAGPIPKCLAPVGLHEVLALKLRG
jgi:hypothetical protein